MTSSDRILSQMPIVPSEIPQWFHSLSDAAFDSVCVSAVTSVVADEQLETGFISVQSVARLTRAMRERYRNICGMESHIKCQAAVNASDWLCKKRAVA